MNPNYNNATLRNDFALIRLATPAPAQYTPIRYNCDPTLPSVGQRIMYVDKIDARSCQEHAFPSPPRQGLPATIEPQQAGRESSWEPLHQVLFFNSASV
jgi:hypothetical protein